MKISPSKDKILEIGKNTNSEFVLIGEIIIMGEIGEVQARYAEMEAIQPKMITPGTFFLTKSIKA